MKTKKISTVKILLLVVMVVHLAATLIFCYETKPEVAEGQFPFSITYEYKGETGTLSGILPSSSIAVASASSLLRPCTCIGASVIFLSML